jgi:hypothetical protein
MVTRERFRPKENFYTYIGASDELTKHILTLPLTENCRRKTPELCSVIMFICDRLPLKKKIIVGLCKGGAVIY